MERPEGMDDLEFAELRRQIEDAADATPDPIRTSDPRAKTVEIRKSTAAKRKPSSRATSLLIAAFVLFCLCTLLFGGVFLYDRLSVRSAPPKQEPVVHQVAEPPMIGVVPRLGDTRENTLALMGTPTEEAIGTEYYMPYDVMWGWTRSDGRVWVTVFRGQVVSVTIKPPLEFYRFNQHQNPQRQLNYIARESMWHQLDQDLYGCSLIGHDGDRLAEIQNGFIYTTMLSWERYSEKH